MFSTSSKIILLLGCFMFVAATRAQEQIVGGKRTLNVEELKQVENELQVSLTKLAAGEGPHYSISKLHSATRQLVSGTLTEIHVELIDSNNVKKDCKVSIWSQPWLKVSDQITFECKGEDKLVKQYGN